MTSPRMLVPGVRVLLAPNPSAMTGAGTNTYILGTRDLAVIDPGPDDPAHLAAVLAAVERGQRISHIFVTHAHLDHSHLAPRLAALTGAPVLAFGSAQDGRSPVMARLAALGLSDGGEGIDAAFTPDLRLPDGAVTEGDGWRLEALHTPGHLGNHLCFAWNEVLFSGDQAMGWSTSLVSPPDGDMGAYMDSLARLAARRWQIMLPGHGDAVRDPAARLAELTRHRHQREAALLAVLARGPATPASLTRAVYTDTPPRLLPAAERNVLAHLIDLEQRSRIAAQGQPGPEAIFHILAER